MQVFFLLFWTRKSFPRFDWNEARWSGRGDWTSLRTPFIAKSGIGRNADKAFVSEVPELPGCTAHRNTSEEALKNVQDAMTLWLDVAKPHEETLKKILHLINEARNENLTMDEERRAALDFNILIGIGQSCLNLPDGEKKKLRKLRKLHNEVCENGNHIVEADSLEGPALTSRQLVDRLMLREDSGGVLTDPLAEILRDFDELLGKKEPARYPCRKIVKDVLKLWIKHTGKNPQKWAIQPSSYSKSKEVPPYALCRPVLTVIEGKDPGDFHRVYESAARSLK